LLNVSWFYKVGEMFVTEHGQFSFAGEAAGVGRGHGELKPHPDV
jgi:hypothetical protein